MVDYIWLWSEMLIRWVHVIAGIAWIGSSFYFIALDLSLKPGKELPEQAHGQAWQVHGGGFYNMVKYLVAPSKMPDELTWFKWEAYGTWISGFALLTVIYYTSAGLYMIDLEILDITELQAVAISVASSRAPALAGEAQSVHGLEKASDSLSSSPDTQSGREVLSRKLGEQRSTACGSSGVGRETERTA